MFETFDDHRSRYASGGIVQTLPSELIDSIWLIIDLDLKGFIPLTNLLTFEVQNNHGRVTLLFLKPKVKSNLVLIYRTGIPTCIPKKSMYMTMGNGKRFYCLVRPVNVHSY